MKNLFTLLLALFTGGLLNAQITLEHTYDTNYGNLQRLNLPGIGEKYCFGDPVQQKIFVYNADHTLWKTVSLSINLVELNSLDVYGVFEPGVIKNDGMIYFNIFYNGINSDGNYENTYLIIDENASTVFNGSSYIITLPSGQKKLISGNKVYQLPGLNLEFTYPYPSLDFFTSRPGAPYDAYFVGIDMSSGSVGVFNTSHQPVKITTLPPTTPGFYGYYVIATDQIGDGTTDFKFLIVEDDPNNYIRKFRLVRDNGTLVFGDEISTLNGNSIFPYFYRASPGLFQDDKIAVYMSNNNTNRITFRFYNMPAFTIEKELESATTVNIEGGVYKYIKGITETNETSIPLYNPNGWSVYQTLTKPTGFWRINDISKYTFDSDNGFETLYTESPDNGNSFTNPIVRDLGTQTKIFEENNYPYGYVSRIPGTNNKLICSYQNYTNKIGKFKVYGLPSSTPLPVVEVARQLDVTVSPNPTAGGDVMVSFEEIPASGVEISVFNAQGELTGQIQSAHNEQFKIPESCFPANGLYFVTVRAGDWKGVTKLIRQ